MVFEDIVSRTGFQIVHRDLFANGARNDNKWNVQLPGAEYFQRLRPGELWQVEVGENNIQGFLQAGAIVRFRFDSFPLRSQTEGLQLIRQQSSIIRRTFYD